VYFLASRDDLRPGSGASSGDSANCCAFSATCNGADDCAERSAAAHKFACALVGSHTIATVL
jgi:hypothetical protein